LWGSYANPGIFPPEDCIYSAPVCSLLYHSNLTWEWALGLNLVVVMGICFLLQQINAQFSFIRVRTFLPSFLFMFIIYTFPEFRIIQPVLFAGLFILLAIRSIFASFEKNNGMIYSFNSAMFISLASIFYLHVALFIFLVPIGIYIIRGTIGFREFLSAFLGLLIPWIYTFAIYFIWFNVNDLLLILRDSFFLTKNGDGFSIALIAYLVFLVILTISASVFIVRQYDEKKISSRRYYKILLFFFLGSVALFAFPSVSYEVLLLATIPLTYLLTNYLTFMRRRVWAEMFFATLGVLAFVMQFIL
jgi:hypothetical protein